MTVAVAELLVVTGPPGAGKSTVSRLLADGCDRSVLLPGDDFFGYVHRGAVAPWTDAAHGQNEVVLDAAAAAAGRFVAGGYPVIVAGMVGPWFRAAFTAASGLARIHYAVLLPAVDVCVQRVLTRPGHGFTDPDAARALHAQSAGTVEARYVVDDAGADPSAVAGWIRERWDAGVLAFPV